MKENNERAGVSAAHTSEYMPRHVFAWVQIGNKYVYMCDVIAINNLFLVVPHKQQIILTYILHVT